VVDKEAVHRQAQQNVIDAAEREFRSTGNPVFAWDAYLRARHEGLAIPEWICCYLDDAARQLGALVDQAESGQSITEPDAQIARAFQMKVGRGKDTVFVQFVRRWRDFEWLAIGEEVAGHIRRGIGETDAIRYVAAEMDAVERAAQEAGYVKSADDEPAVNPTPSASTVRKAWLRYKQERS
jgi:hypothetical protein